MTVRTNGALGGVGSIYGPVTVQAGGTLAPGTNDLSPLSIYNTLASTAGGTALMRISKTGGTPANASVQGLTGVTYAGTLVVTNVTSDTNQLALNDKFALFVATPSTLRQLLRVRSARFAGGPEFGTPPA